MAHKYAGELLFIFALLGFLTNVLCDLKVTVPKCCQLGINWQNEGLRCHNYPRPVLDVPDAEQDLCLKTIKLCCEKNLKQNKCQKGIDTYKKEKTCSFDASNFFENLAKKCCDSCHLGATLGESKVPCSAIDIPLEDELKNVMISCCNEVNPSPVTEKPVIKPKNQTKPDYDNYEDYGVPSPPPDNLCDLLPDQLCAQICVPTHGSYYCKCEEGFILMEDQKTCQKDLNQSTKPKPSSTVAPRAIIPNPEKPVPLHKPKEKPIPRYIPTTTASTTVGSKPTTVTKNVASLSTTPTSKDTDQPSNSTTKALNSITTPTPAKESCLTSNPCEQECIDTGSGYRCDCRAGYTINDDGKTCEDVDECLADTYVCDESEECVNKIGGYACLKKEETTSTTFKPTEMTAATTATKTTPTASPTTITTPVSVSTPSLSVMTASPQETTLLAVVPKEPSGLCPIGFEEISGRCTDINECDYDQYPEACEPDHECVNTPGSFLCRCKPGFQESLTTFQCEDINECQTNAHTCMASQRCDNTIGSFRCVRFTGCGTGYTLNLQSGQCEDNDECKLGTDTCRYLGNNYICRNTQGSFRCEKKRCLQGDETCDPEKQCPPGYIQSESGNCVDLDECATRNNNCHPFADVCINRVGSFECRRIIHCPKGYEATAHGCVDIDECATRKHNCKGLAECRNGEGTYSCVCPTGYQLAHDNSCEDINECSLYMCSYNSKCINTPGSYRCDCNIGFRNVNESTCQDIDECSISPGICQHTCINVHGSFRCTCKTGFRLHANNRTCSDLNECEVFKNQRLCIGECVNIPGSFTCRCPPGYTLGPDGRSCQDIDECQRNPCRGEDEMCLNTRGSYRCNSIKCPPNYVKDAGHKNRCKRIKTYCREDDMNCLQQPLTYSFNFITFVSMLPIPPSGHLDLFTMRGPPWLGNSQFTLELLTARAAQKVTAATGDCFRLRNSDWNQGVISLIRPIPGPQEIELQLTMKMYHNQVFVGSGVAKLHIHVSEFEF